MKNLFKILIVVIIGVATNENGFSTVPITTIITQTADNLKTDKMENEIWKDVKGYEGLYQVSNLGRVKSLGKKVEWMNVYRNTPKKILKFGDDGKGYVTVSLNKDGVFKRKYIHQIICDNYLPNPENKPFVNHKNGIRIDNRLENLEWCTQHENILHAWETGLSRPSMLGKFGKNHNKSKKIHQYLKSGELVCVFYGAYEASRKTGIRPSGIYASCCGKTKTAGGFTWKWIV